MQVGTAAQRAVGSAGGGRSAGTLQSSSLLPARHPPVLLSLGRHLTRIRRVGSLVVSQDSSHFRGKTLWRRCAASGLPSSLRDGLLAAGHPSIHMRERRLCQRTMQTVWTVVVVVLPAWDVGCGLGGLKNDRSSARQEPTTFLTLGPHCDASSSCQPRLSPLG